MLVRPANTDLLMLSKISASLGFSILLEEDSHRVTNGILEHLDHMNLLPYLCDQKSKPITFRYKSDTLSLIPRKNCGQSQFPRINVKYNLNRQEVAQFVLEIRESDLAVKQYNAPPIIQLNKLQKVMKIHRKTKASAALFFLTRMIDRTSSSSRAKKIQAKLAQLAEHRNELARTEAVPANADNIVRQITKGLNVSALILSRFSTIETPTVKSDVFRKLNAILEISNQASEAILQRLSQYPELRVSVRPKYAQRALTQLIDNLVNTTELGQLHKSINRLKLNLSRLGLPHVKAAAPPNRDHSDQHPALSGSDST